MSFLILANAAALASVITGSSPIGQKSLTGFRCQRLDEQMIVKAESKGGGAKYILADINSFHPSEKYDVVHSMEVLYYLDDPAELLKRISDSWLNDGGRLIVGIDHYYENNASHSWQDKVGTRMLMFNEKEWLLMFKEAGLQSVQSWRANKSSDWEGTLVITGVR